jgi:hypothetical protein
MDIFVKKIWQMQTRVELNIVLMFVCTQEKNNFNEDKVVLKTF